MLFIGLIFLLSGLGAGCKKQTRRTTTLASTPAVKADSAEAQKSFDDALDALEQGRYQESQEAFKAVQANHEGDAIAPVAELYAVRAEIGAIVLEASGVSAPQLSPAEDRPRLEGLVSRLQALSSARRVDERIRWSARVYEAMLWHVAADRRRALAALENYPSASLNGLILEQDRPLAWLLLLEAMEKSERPEEAFVAAAMLWQSAQDLRLEDGVSNALARFARAKGAAISLDSIDEESLQLQFLTSDSAFLRGFAGWSLIARHRDDATVDQEAMGKIYGVASVALLDVGAMEQAAEINAYLATMDTTERIVIGALIPMEGANKGIGARVMRGLLLAQQAYTGDSKGARLTLLFRDSTQPAEENMAWFKRQGALAIVGPIDKSLVKPYSAQAQKEEIVLLPLTPQALERGGGETLTWTFRYFLDIESEARAMARIAATQYKDRTAAIIWPNVGYGQTMAKAFRDEFTARGGTIVAEVEYPREDTEFTRTAAKVSKAKPDAIFIHDTGKKVSEIVSFLAKENVWGVPGAQAIDRKSRLQTHYLGTSLWQDPFLVQHAATYVTGATIPVWFSRVAGDAQTMTFLAHYARVFASGEPTIYEAFAYDATELLEQLVLQQGSPQSASIRDAFLVGQWEGVTGKVRFTSSGEPERELRLLTVKKGEFSPLELRQLADAPNPSN